VDNILELCRLGNWEEVRKQVQSSRDYVVRILVAGILHREFSMGKAMETAAADEIQKMRRYFIILDTMITIAPLFGIFGTVTGIITSFELLGTGGIQNPQAVTAGIAQALITTATGLAIAIPSVFAYNHFNARAEKAAQAVEKYATSLEIVYDKLTQGSLCPQRGREHESQTSWALRKARIEMLPLIDMVFLILVCFHLRHAFHGRSSGSAGHAACRRPSASIERDLFLSITARSDGSLFLDKESRSH
jgi:biopolymer transport protein ExbB